MESASGAAGRDDPLHRGGTVPRILLALLVVVGSTLAIGRSGSATVDHHYEGPVYRNGKIVDYAAELAERRPEIVLMGNSYVKRGVDIVRFQDAVGASATKLFHGGGASALYYVFFKYLLLPLEHRPRIVAIFFRHVYLTEPTYRTFGTYKQNMDYYVAGEDPELDRIGFFPGMGPVEFFLKRHWSLYDRRASLREAVERVFKVDLASAVSGREPLELRSAVERAFESERSDDGEEPGDVRPDLVPLSDEAYDFAGNVERSFLPPILAMADEAGIRLVMVRMRTRDEARGLDEHLAELREAYCREFDAYMAERGIPVLDFRHAEEIRKEHFDNGDHLGDEGKQVFTELLVERFAPLVPGLLEER